MYSSGNIDVRNFVHLFKSPCILEYAELSCVSELLYAARTGSFVIYTLSQVLNSDQTFEIAFHRNGEHIG
jgi:hypothetical protein